jgi:hypothetical protein
MTPATLTIQMLLRDGFRAADYTAQTKATRIKSDAMSTVFKVDHPRGAPQSS